MEQIGIATMQYDESGKVIEAYFTPRDKVQGVDLNQLKTIQADQNIDVIRYNAEMVMAGWFSKVNEIELADRDHYKVTSETIWCDKYPNGSVKRCSIGFYFEEIKQPAL